MKPKRYLFYISQNYSFAILRPLQKEIIEQGGEVAWFFEGHEVNTAYLKEHELRLNSVSDVIDFQPLAAFVPGNVIPSFIPGLKVALFHGFNSGKRNRRGFEDHFNIRGCFDLYCTQGPNTTIRFEELERKHQYFCTKETGWPAIDPLFNSVGEIKNKLPTILMCSTFSRNLTCAPHLFETIKQLSEDESWVWIIQFHPKMNKEIVDQYKSIQSKKLRFVETDDVIPLLQEADVMVCDTSSILIMFLLQNKPVVTFKNINPKEYLIDINTPEKLKGSIERAFSRSPELMENISQFINETHPYQDGLSSRRVLDAVDEMCTKHRQAKKPKPWNVFRHFKMRKRLGYWKFW